MICTPAGKLSECNERGCRETCFHGFLKYSVKVKMMVQVCETVWFKSGISSHCSLTANSFYSNGGPIKRKVRREKCLLLKSSCHLLQTKSLGKLLSSSPLHLFSQSLFHSCVLTSQLHSSEQQGHGVMFIICRAQWDTGAIMQQPLIIQKPFRKKQHP